MPTTIPCPRNCGATLTLLPKPDDATRLVGHCACLNNRAVIEVAADYLPALLSAPVTAPVVDAEKEGE